MASSRVSLKLKPILLLLVGLVCIGTIWGQYSIVARGDSKSYAQAKKQIEALEAERVILKQQLHEAQNRQQPMGNDAENQIREMPQIAEERDPESKEQSFQQDLNSCHALQVSMYKDRAMMFDENANLKQELLVAKGERNVDKWEMEELPIMKSISRGFHPVYVYSMATPERRKESYAQVRQDVFVLALLKANNAKNTTTDHSINTKPFFVDLAANDAIMLSNTYLLESNGWDGLCIEPNPRYWYRLSSFRKCTIVGAFVGGTNDGAEVDVILTQGKTGGIVGGGMDNRVNGEDHDGGVFDVKEIEKRNLVSLMTVFNETNVPRVIDYLSLDVEGAESLVMEHFPWTYYTIKIVTIERPKRDLIRLLHSMGYEEVSVLSTWGESLWIHKASVLLSQEEIDTVAASVGAKNFK